MYRPHPLLLCLGILAASGCNESTEGTYENISFTPRDCGAWNTGCAFDDSIGVGGLVNVQIAGINGFSTAGVTLGTEDTAVLDVTPIADIGGRPAWQLMGLDAGVARLQAYDTSQEIVDFIEVSVQPVTALVLEDFIGDAVASDPGAYDETWIVQAETDTSFYVVPTIGEGVRTMGRFPYDATLDAEVLSGLLPSADVGEGYLAFNVPAGDYEVSFETISADPLYLDVLISAQTPGG